MLVFHDEIRELSGLLICLGVWLTRNLYLNAIPEAEFFPPKLSTNGFIFHYSLPVFPIACILFIYLPFELFFRLMIIRNIPRWLATVLKARGILEFVILRRISQKYNTTTLLQQRYIYFTKTVLTF